MIGLARLEPGAENVHDLFESISDLDALVKRAPPTLAAQGTLLALELRVQV